MKLSSKFARRNYEEVLKYGHGKMFIGKITKAEV
jgi:hypothetical protein